MPLNRENTPADWTPGVRVKVEELNRRFPDLTWGTYGGHHPTKNRATDGMVPGWQTDKGQARGWVVAKWLWANAERLGVWYVIFDGKIASRTRPAAGWRTYYPTAAAIAKSAASAYHRNHVHLSFYDLASPVEFLPPYLVDPAKISTEMVANATLPGQDDKLVKPLFRIWTGVEIITRTNGAGEQTQWLKTKAGFEYFLDFLILESVYKASQPPIPTPPKPVPPPDPIPAPPPPPPPPPPVTKVRVATYNILSDAAGIAGGEGPLAARLPLIIATIRKANPTVLFLQECNKDAAALVQAELGADWVWSRVGTRTVMVDKRVWTMGEERKIPLPAPHVDVDKSFPLVELTHVNGDTAWACSVHFVSKAGNDATDAQIDAQRLASAEALVEVAKPLPRFIGGGDLNTYSMAKGKAKPALIAGGLSLLTRDPAFKAPTLDSFPNKTPGGQHIDDVFGKGVRFTHGEIIASRGSDHNLLLADLTLDKEN